MLMLINDNLSHNSLLELSDGRGLALVPPGTREGDLLCVVSHCNYPVMLRRVGENHVHVGPCYAFGFMDGEAALMIGKIKLKMQDFAIV